MIKVYDDWCNPVLKTIIEQTFLSNQLNWHLPTNKWSTVHPKAEKQQVGRDSRILNCHQMVHRIIIDGIIEYGSTLSPLMLFFIESFFESLDFPATHIDVYRIKANLIHRQKSCKNCFNPPHVDFTMEKQGLKPVVCLYYVNDSDGDTFFFDNNENLNVIERVTPKSGRMVVFDNDIFHASSPPVKSDARIVINTNLFLPIEARTLV